MHFSLKVFMNNKLWQWLVMLILSFTAAACQVVTSGSYSTVSTCTQGLIANENRFILTGSARLDGSDATEWPRILTFETKPDGGTYSGKCYIYLNNCASSPPTCSCTLKSGDEYELKINFTATETYSNVLGQFSWSNKNGSLKVSSAETRFQPVFNKDDNFYTLKLNNLPIDLTSCNFKVTEGSNSNVTSCCPTGLSCTSTILFNGTKLTSGNTCASYQPKESGSYIFTFELCPNSNYKKTYSCDVSMVDSPGDTQDSTTIIIIVVVVVGSCLIIGIVIGLLFYFKVLKCGEDCCHKKEHKLNSGHPLADTPTATATAATTVSTAS